MTDRFDPDATLYLVVAQGNLDGSVDFHTEQPDGYPSFEAAHTAAEADVERYDLPSVVYECKPIARYGRVVPYTACK